MKAHLSLLRNLRAILFSTLLGLALVTTTGVHQRTTSASGEEWRPIDPAEMALKAPIVEPDADAEALFWDIRVDDGGQNDLVLSHYIRIKIFTDRGRELESKIEIPFLKGTKIKDIAARTIKPDGSIVELAKDDVLEKTVVKASGLKLRTRNFALPSIETGAIVEYKWKETISNASANNMRLDFQRDIPVESITYHIKPSSNVAGTFDVRAFNMQRPQFQKEGHGFQSTTVTKMPAFHEEPLMPPADNVRSWALIKYQTLFSLFAGYSFLAHELYIATQPYLKVDDEIKRKSDELIAGAKTPEEKLEKIFAFCRANIKNTSERGSGFTREEISKLKENKKSADTLKRGVGPAIDVNLLFGALANAAGFEAYLALAPDRGKRFFDRNVSIPGALLPANIAVRVGDTWKFFDPGFHYVTPGMLRWQEEGVDALIASASPVWIKTPVSSQEKSRETRKATLRLDESGTLEGDVTVDHTGHLAVEKKIQNDDDSPSQREDDLKEAVKKRLGTAELTNIVIENATDSTKPFIYKYHIRVPDYAQRTGKRLFLQPGFFEKGVGPLFTASKRTYPVYFHFPWSEEDAITIVLPKGYALDNADAPAPINAPGFCNYSVKMGITTDEPKTLVFNRHAFFGSEGALVIPLQSYGPLKNLFDQINKADNHDITLKQTTAGK